jgi:hypothetical protein
VEVAEVQLGVIAETPRASEGVRASWVGGESVQLESLADPLRREAHTALAARLPTNAAVMANTLACWRMSPQRRALRTMFSLAIKAHGALAAHASSRRKEATTAFYTEVNDLMTALGASHAALGIVLERFRGRGDHVNLFDLAPYVGARAALAGGAGVVRNVRRHSVASAGLPPL